MNDGAIAILIGAASLGVVALGATELSDVEALKISVSAGVFGGVVATLLRKEPSTWKQVIAMILASAMFAPAIVYAWMIYDKAERLTLFPVWITAGLAGLFAWLVFSKLMQAGQDIRSGDIRDWLLSLLKRRDK